MKSRTTSISKGALEMLTCVLDNSCLQINLGIAFTNNFNAEPLSLLQLAQLLCPTADISLGFPNQLQQKEVLLTTQPCQNTTLGHVPSTPSTTTYLAQNPVSTSLPFSIPIVSTPVIRRSSAASLQVYTRLTTCRRHAIPFHAFWRDVEISVSFQQFTAHLGAAAYQHYPGTSSGDARTGRPRRRPFRPDFFHFLGP